MIKKQVIKQQIFEKSSLLIIENLSWQFSSSGREPVQQARSPEFNQTQVPPNNDNNKMYSPSLIPTVL
jgi:hypothetical protein